VTLLGTAHVSRSSVEKVREILATEAHDAVAVELCPSRQRALLDPESLAQMDLFQVLRGGRAPMVVASLALAAYQQRLAEQLGVEPGAEMRAAIEGARSAGLPVLLIDREVGVTLRRIYRALGWRVRLALLAGLGASVFSDQRVSEEEIERLKEGDLLETTFAQFAEERGDLYEPLIDERDRYMAARIREEMGRSGYRRVLAVVGAGHLRGLAQHLAESSEEPAQTIARLDRVPPPSRWPRVLPWLVIAVILSGFVIGFSRSPTLGWQLVWDWVVINGGLAAIGALVAGAHPASVLTAFAAAPLTSLNPTIGAGMPTAAVEMLVRRPKVGDFSSLRRDTAHLRGWWRNRVSRTLLVFVLSTLGSAVGTYVAGFRILDRLTGG
jgi:pheromone shutdown-related protein TraB